MFVVVVVVVVVAGVEKTRMLFYLFLLLWWSLMGFCSFSYYCSNKVEHELQIKPTDSLRSWRYILPQDYLNTREYDDFGSE